MEFLRGRVGIVTGAGRGIGRAIATTLATEGMSLVLVARGGAEIRSLAEELADRYGVRCFPAAIDITDPAAIGRVVMHAEQQLGPIDLLVNNAAIVESAPRPFWRDDPAETWRVVETNLRGPMLMTHAILAAMVQRGRGHIVNIASRARAATENGACTGYAVSKSALSTFTTTLAAQLAGTGVVVVDVLPGLVRTDLTKSMPVWDSITEWDPPTAAAAVVVGVATGRYDDRTGQLLDATTAASPPRAPQV